jgi:hypothetical protein
MLTPLGFASETPVFRFFLNQRSVHNKVSTRKYPPTCSSQEALLHAIPRLLHCNRIQAIIIKARILSREWITPAFFNLA